MQVGRRRILKLASGAAALPALLRIAKAQTYPTKAITMVVPFAAGGPTDVIGRILAQRMRASLDQPVIIENVAGALTADASLRCPHPSRPSCVLRTSRR